MEGCADDCRCPSSSASSLDAPRFLLAAAAAAQHDGHSIGELPRIDPDTQARIEALLEAAGKNLKKKKSETSINIPNLFVYYLYKITRNWKTDWRRQQTARRSRSSQSVNIQCIVCTGRGRRCTNSHAIRKL